MRRLVLALLLALALVLATVTTALAKPTASVDAPCGTGQRPSATVDISGAPPLSPPQADPVVGSVEVDCSTPTG